MGEIKPQVLVVDDEEIIRKSLKRLLNKEELDVDLCPRGNEVIDTISKKKYDLMILDLKLPGIDGLELLKRIRATEENRDLMIIVITGYPEIDTAVKAIRLGAFDYIAKPFDIEQIRVVINRALQHRRLLYQSEFLSRLKSRGSNLQIIGRSRAMQKVFEIIEKVAPTDSTVLIYGESGTGKELVARAIHQASPRWNKEFVAVDCSALVETLLESELFGHVKGSFTGAIQTKHGFFELANGGTFLFDEIGNLSLNIQAKLLRVLQEKEFSKVGSEKKVKVDLRIIASTNSDLRELVSEGKFREDLFYRLSVVPIYMPPLKERKEDIPLLVHHFIEKYRKKRRKPIIGISDDAMEILMNYNWPGNVRELEHTIERIIVLEDDKLIQPHNLPWYVFQGEKRFGIPFPEEPLTLEEMEKRYIRFVLNKCEGNKSRAAKILGINRKTLSLKVKKYGL